MICSYCQTDNPIEAKFCMNCGKSLVLTCSQCGKGNPPQAKYCINCGQPLFNSVEPIVDPIQRYIPKEYAEKLEQARKFQTMKGERRIVTILFCDVKGSTAMAEKLDPEEWAEIINQAFEYLIAPIYQYEGTLARLMGDSVLAFFGAPIAHEDDAQRAILAGLEIIRAIQPFREKIFQRYKLDFNVRVGINTGLVVVGGVGSDLFMEYTALGDAINIAARMEQTALPGTIQIAEDTYKKVNHIFDLEAVEGVEIKGKSDPILVYRVLQLKETPDSNQGIQGIEAPLVGRSAEVEQLSQILDTVKKGRGQIVSLVADAGLGKSRLLQEVRTVWENIGLGVGPFGIINSRWNQVIGVSYESSRPYGLIQRLIRNFIGLSASDSPEVVRDTLKTVFETAGYEIAPKTLAIFETVLGVKEPDNGSQLKGEELKKAIYRELFSTLDFLVQQGPTVIVIDDLHWSDETSAEFIIHLFQLANRLPILFLCAFRPDRLSPAWKVRGGAESEYPHRYTEISLAPLSIEDSNVLVDRLFNQGDISPVVRKMILDKSDGNPFFIEEVIRTLIDNNFVIRDHNSGRLRVTSSIDDITIPDNLQMLLAARIDRLEESAKQVLQMASVIGRSFDYQVLEIITDTTNELDIELNYLQRLGLIIEVSREPYLEFVFRQALTQETAYNTILLKNRREFHRRVGEALIQLYPERSVEFAAILGHHFYQARDPRAFIYFELEGDSAFRLYANQEAIHYYSMAIEALIWADEPDLEQLVYLFKYRGRAYELNSQFTEALANYKEMELLTRKFNAVTGELDALIAQAQIHSVPSNEFNLEAGMDYVEKAKSMAEQLDDKPALAKIYWITTNLYRFTNSGQALPEGEKAIALARELKLEEQLAYSITDTALIYSMNGKIYRSRELFLEAVELWRKLNNKPMLADCLSGLAVIYVFAGEFDLAYRCSDEAYDLSTKIENVWGQSYSRYTIGFVDLERGDIDIAIRKFNQSRKDALESNFYAGQILTNTFLSVLYSELGHHQLAIETIDGVFDDRPENMAMAQSFFLGAELLSRVLAGKVDEADKLVAQERFTLNQMNFFSKLYTQLALCYLQFIKGDYQVTIQISNDFYSQMQTDGVVYLTPEVLLLIAKSQIALNLRDEAESTLEKARQVAEKLTSRRSQWEIDYLLGECELFKGDQGKASVYFQQSKDDVIYILDHISDQELRESFLQLESVQRVLDTELVLP